MKRSGKRETLDPRGECASGTMSFAYHRILAKCSWRLLTADPQLSVAAAQVRGLFLPLYYATYAPISCDTLTILNQKQPETILRGMFVLGRCP